MVKRIEPRPASRIGPSTAWTAATAPTMLNSSGPRMSSAVVSRIGFMNSRAGSGEYSSTSTSPSRPARAWIAWDERVGLADVGGLARGPDAVLLELLDEPVELGLVARHEPDGHALAPEAAADGKAEVRARLPR